MIIPAREADFSRLSIVDSGRVFLWKGRLFRAIDPKDEDAVHALFNSGLVAELVAKKLLVPSRISDLRMEDGTMLVEHSLLPIPTYPREWSFNMTRMAAMLVLEVNEVAARYGYQTKDCNGYNVLFDHCNPVFVDLGSFVPACAEEDSLLSYEEFLLSYLFPMKLWSSGGHSLGSRSMPRAGGSLLPIESYARFRWPLFRWVGSHHITHAFKVLCSLRTLRHNDFSRLRSNTKGWVVSLLGIIKRHGLFRNPARIRSLRREIRGLRANSGNTLWSGYHSAYSKGTSLTSTERFDCVVRRICDSDATSVTEIGGNQGVVSRLAKRRKPALQVVCTDPDSVAIDSGFVAARASNDAVHWAVLNPFAAESSTLEIGPEDRFRSDLAVALALTHHLVLSQGYRIEYVLDVIGSYARKSVMIEFMPLGMFDGQRGPTPPTWYNEDWFLAAFCKRFQFVERIQLEENRILFIGKVRTQAPPVRG